MIKSVIPIVRESNNSNKDFTHLALSYFNVNTKHDFYNDFETSKALVEFVYNSYSNSNNPLIYLEYTNGKIDTTHIDTMVDNKDLVSAVVDFLVKKSSNPNITAFTIRDWNIGSWGYSKGVTNTEDYNKNYTVIVLKPDQINPDSNSIQSTPLWTIIHEVTHSLLKTSDEEKVQQKTFDILYNLGFYEDYGYEFVKCLLSIDNAEYNIVNYVIGKLSNDKPVLYDILNTSYYILNDMNKLYPNNSLLNSKTSFLLSELVKIDDTYDYNIEIN